MDESERPVDPASDFEQLASRHGGRRSGVAGDFLYFLRRTRKWWMAPIIVTLLLITGMLVLSTTAAAPLIYALF